MPAGDTRALGRLREELGRPLGPAEWLLEMVAAAGLLAALGLALTRIPTLPGRIPIHFGFGGRPDRFGRPGELWELLAIQALTFALLSGVLWLMRRGSARWLNLPTATERNAPRLARVLRLNLRLLKAWTTWTFTYIVWGTVRVARGEAEGLGEGFAVAMLLLSHVQLIAFLWTMARASQDRPA